jgi:hypothetical protein
LVDLDEIENRIKVPEKSPEAAKQWGLLEGPIHVTRRAKVAKAPEKVSQYDVSETPSNIL